MQERRRQMIGNRKNKWLLLLITITCFLSISIGVSAKTPAMRLDVDNYSMEMGGTYQLTLTFQDMGSGGISDVYIEGIDNFEMLSKSQSTSKSMINGDVTEQMQLHINIRPLQVGEFKLKAYATYKKQQYSTNGISVTVKEQSQALRNEERDVFIQTELSKEEAYFGEKIVLSYDLYTRYNIDQLGFIEQPSFDGMIINEETDVTQPKVNTVTINGQQYLKYEVKKVALSPTKTGEIVIPAYDFQVVLRSADFFSRGKAVDLLTEQKTITIQALPTEGKPSNYAGLIGDFQVESSYNMTQVEYGDSITLKATFTGEGNLEVLGDLYPNKNQDISIYETQGETSKLLSQDGYKLSKTYDVILVPKVTGEVTFEGKEIPYFNVATGQYDELVIQGTTIDVLGEQVSASAAGKGYPEVVSRETVLINQINPGAMKVDYFVIPKVWFYVGSLTVILIGLVIVILIVVNRRKGESTLKEYYKMVLKTKDPAVMYDNLSTMIKEYYGISLRASSRDTINEGIQDSHVVKEIFHVMDLVENKSNRTTEDITQIKNSIKFIYNRIK